MIHLYLYIVFYMLSHRYHLSNQIKSNLFAQQLASYRQNHIHLHVLFCHITCRYMVYAVLQLLIYKYMAYAI